MTHSRLGCERIGAFRSVRLEVELACQFNFDSLLQLPGGFLGKLVAAGHRDVAFELLGIEVPGVIQKHLSLALGHLQGELSRLDSSLAYKPRFQRGRVLLRLEAVLCPGQFRLRELDLTLDRGQISGTIDNAILLDGDLGELAV